MSWDDGSLDHSAAKQARTMIAPHGDGGLAPGPDWADLRSAARWLEGRGVAALGVALIAASIAWKAQFLGHLYFRQDDFHLLDRAFTNPLSWKELTFIGAGHLIPGPYLIAWLVTRISLYDWGLASAVLLAFVAAAGLAALRLLRTLFGDRPTILIPLVYYLLCPLTVPDLGIWSSALESLPLQLAIFSALNAQVRYVSTQRVVHLLSAVFWVAFGMFFFEKGLVVPLLLFAITSGFLMGEGPWLANARRCASRYWKAWLIYAIEIVGYSVLLKVALKTSLAQPAAPRSASPVLMFVDTLVRQTLLPGAVGGPWHWFTTIDASYAFAAAPATLTWLSLIIAGLVVVGSILHSRT